MRGFLDAILYVLTAPVRLFGRSARFRLALGALVIVVLFFSVTLWALDKFFPSGGGGEKPTALTKLPELPPLQPVTRASYVIAPVAISLDAIGRSLDAAAPRDLVGKNDNPVSSLLSKADISITVSRGAMSVDRQAQRTHRRHPAQRRAKDHRADRRRCRRRRRRHHRPAQLRSRQKASAS